MRLPWVEPFLKRLAKSPNVSEAAKAAKVSRDRAYEYRNENPEFAARWEQAIETAVDQLEQKAWGRAEETSDTLAIFLLKAHRPGLYRENVVHTHNGTFTYEVEYVNNWRTRPTPTPQVESAVSAPRPTNGTNGSH